MKKLILSALTLVLSTSAFAEIPEIRAKNVTCQELQEAVLNYGTVTVLTKAFLSTKRLTVAREIECGGRSIKTQAVFKTSDVSACAAGLYCKAEPTVIIVVDHEPRHDRYHPRPHRPAPHRPTPTPRPRPDRPHRVPDHHNPGPRYNPRPSQDRPSHDRPRTERPSRPSHDRVERPSRPSHDRPSHDRPSRPSHDRPSRDSGSCRGRRC
ncbi:MAG: hypothetical protein V4598_03405 [Bdellovibrionota bacterium]